MSFQFQFVNAILFILVAAVFDFFDGMIARLLKVNSEIGKELDSMADMISFGVSPFFLVMLFLLNESGLPSINELITQNYFVLVLALIPAMSAIRLAKFNLDTNQNDGFIGLNTPSNTLFIISLPFVCTKLNLEFEHSLFLVISLAALSSLLLNANIPMINLKFKNLSFKDNLLRFILIGLSAAIFLWSLLVDFIALSFPIIILLYFILSLIENRQKNDI